MRGLLTSLFTLGVIAPIAVGQQPLLDTWDAAYLQGSRAGYIHTRTDEIDHDGAKLWRTTMELRLTVKRFNDSVQLGMDTGTFETPEGKVTGVFMRQYLGKAKKLDIQGTAGIKPAARCRSAYLAMKDNAAPAPRAGLRARANRSETGRAAAVRRRARRSRSRRRHDTGT
jgi:hypothetical protein